MPIDEEQYKEIIKQAADIIKNEQPPTMETDNLDEEANAEVYNSVAALLSIAHGQYKKHIVDIFEKRSTTEDVPQEAMVLFHLINSALMLNPPRETIETLAEKLGTDADTMEQIKKDIAAAIKDVEDNTPFIPGLEPTEKKQVNRIPQTVDYTKSLLKPTSKLNRRIGFVMNADNLPVPLDIPSNVPLEKSKQCIYLTITQATAADGKPQTITPYDQEVENTISNLFEDGNNEVTAQQIYCKMNGITSSGKRITPAALAEIDNSIRKLNRTYVDLCIVEKIGKEKKERRIKDGHILDTFCMEDRFCTSGKVKSSWISTRPGILYLAEKDQKNRLVSVEPAQLNLLESGIQLTPLSITIRHFCLEEIFRIASTGSYNTFRNKFLLDRFYTYDRDPTLTEVILPTDGAELIEVKLKTGKDAKEKNRIRQAKFIRRNLLQEILEHLKATNALNDWDFVEKDRKLPYTLVEDEKNPGRKKRKYDNITAADGVLLDVSKTIGASKRIVTADTIQTKAKKIKEEEAKKKKKK